MIQTKSAQKDELNSNSDLNQTKNPSKSSRIDGVKNRMAQHGLFRTVIFLFWWTLPTRPRVWLERFIARVFWFFGVKQLMVGFQGKKICIDPRSSWTVRVFYILGKYDCKDIDTVKAVVNKKYAFIDVGANFGIWTYSLSDHFENTWAVEPNPNCFACLERTKKHLNQNNVTLVKAAISEKDGEGKLFPYVLYGDDRIYDPNAPFRQKAISVKILSFDSFVQKFNVDTTRMFIKLDIQGVEPLVIKGMGETLKTAEDIILFTEANEGLLAAAGEWSVMKYFNLLKDAGFKPVDFYSNLREINWDDVGSKSKTKDYCFRYER